MKGAILFLLLFFQARTLHGQIYADVNTSLGTYTIELNYTAAPRSVANFIGLADGSRAWIDSSTGAIHSGEPFYNGLHYHRVIAGFMSQVGSRKGDGTDGPGYSFRDEFSSGLSHSSAYIVSMANSGPNSNGSQFFITAEATAWLDGKHTIFGSVVSGTSVCAAINNTAVTNSVPNTPVVINSITIRRVGSAANAFDITAQGLPSVSRSVGNLIVSPGVSAAWVTTQPQTEGTVFTAFKSTNLSTWSSLNASTLYLGSNAQSSFSLGTAQESKAFFNLAAASHPSPTTVSSYANRTLSVSAPTSLGGTMVFTFNSSGSGGVFQIVSNSGSTSGTFSTFQSTHDIYNSSLIALTSFTVGSQQFIPYVKCGWDSVGTSTITGHHQFSYWNGITWVDLETNTCTITR
jgi:cyclophilin family peptidyl-prolyl cis-trans isomerase